ncbi:MAG: carbohydrate binding family 9 domain-containing protein, partial [Gemmatimonadota bacterium]|nr:carbohydrate binding family 9 domain-containing protein [Gemmatimonadota bacterium]
MTAKLAGALSLLLLAVSGLTASLAGQLPDGGGPLIDGPPAPVAPAVVTRDAAGNATVRAVRLNEPIRLDGVLDEPFYANTLAISDYIQAVPDNGAPPTERTESWISFDDTDIYVSARNWDSAPESEWVANEMRRDTNQLRNNDSFGVMFDTYYDRRNGVMFYTNPLGALAEFAITNEGNPNTDWNPVWDVRVGRFEGGWTVEMRIPFKSLRYRPGRDQVWGVQLRRAIRRKNEWNHLTFLSLAVAGGGAQGSFRVSRAGTLVGLQAPPASRVVELKPYGIAGLSTDLNATPDPIRNDLDADGGVDLKVGITENLTADFTYRTDFAQVEVDEQQVNLSRFTLFFPEKREFFLEGRGIFDFGTSGGGGFGGGGVSAPTMFFSRRIGLQGFGGGSPVPIIGGGRVTGKVGAFDVGALSIQTDDLASVGAESTNFSVVRLRRDIFRRSSIGVLYENRSESVVADGSNQLYGVDGSFSFFEDLSFLSYYATTRTEGLIGSDDSYRAQVAYGGDLIGARVDHLFVGEDFNPELGFARRRGLRETYVTTRVSPRPASIDWIRQVTLEGRVDYLENHPGGFVESREFQGQFGIEFENSDSFSANFTESYENLQDVFNIASGVAIPAGRYDFRSASVSYGFGLQRPYSGNLSAQYGSFYDGTRTSVGFQRARIALTPQLSMEPNISFNWVDLPGGDFTQHVASTRLSYSFSPRLFLSGLVQYSTQSDALGANL